MMSAGGRWTLNDDKREVVIDPQPRRVSNFTAAMTYTDSAAFTQIVKNDLSIVSTTWAINHIAQSRGIWRYNNADVSAAI